MVISASVNAGSAILASSGRAGVVFELATDAGVSSRARAVQV